MRFKLLAIATVFVGGAAMGYGGVEGDASAAQVQVPDDQRCPALREDLSAAGDWAVLAVGPHDASIAHQRSAVKSSFLT